MDRKESSLFWKNEKTNETMNEKKNINWTMNRAIRCSSLIQRQWQMSLLSSSSSLSPPPQPRLQIIKKRLRHWNAYGLCIQLYTISCSPKLLALIMIVCCNFPIQRNILLLRFCYERQRTVSSAHALWELDSNAFVPWQWHNWGTSKSAKQHKSTPI